MKRTKSLLTSGSGRHTVHATTAVSFTGANGLRAELKGSTDGDGASGGTENQLNMNLNIREAFK